MLAVHRRVRLFSTFFHIFALVACGRGAASGNAAGASAFKVALLTPGPISDHAWNAGAYQGLLRIRDSIGAHISHIQVKTPADFEENFRAYGAQGYNLVFGHGFEFQDAASRVGPEYPQTIYITTSGNRSGPNVAPMIFGFEEPSYLAGIIAGTLSRSRVVGVIGGTDLPPVKSSFLAFTAGVHAIDPLYCPLPTSGIGMTRAPAKNRRSHKSSAAPTSSSRMPTLPVWVFSRPPRSRKASMFSERIRTRAAWHRTSSSQAS